MIRLVLSLLLIGTLEGRCDLVNTQSAARDLYGIEIFRAQKAGGSRDDQSIVVKYDRTKVGGSLLVVVRNEAFKEFGEFEFVTPSDEAKAGTGEARFSLNPDYLHRSFLKTEKHLIPLRLYFDEKGENVDGADNPQIEATSSYSLKVWSVDVSFYKAQFGKVVKGPSGSLTPDSKPIFPQSKTQEELFRSWGLIPPEGTEFFSAGGKAAVVVRSTKTFLGQLENELKTRGYLVEGKK